MGIVVKQVNTDYLDSGWDDLFPGADELHRACERLAFYVEARRAVRDPVPSPREIQVRADVIRLLDHRGMTAYEGPGWRVCRTQTRYRVIGDEHVPVASDGVRVTIRKQ
jgi:hypothetical protein